MARNDTPVFIFCWANGKNDQTARFRCVPQDLIDKKIRYAVSLDSCNPFSKDGTSSEQYKKEKKERRQVLISAFILLIIACFFFLCQDKTQNFDMHSPTFLKKPLFLKKTFPFAENRPYPLQKNKKNRKKTFLFQSCVV